MLRVVIRGSAPTEGDGRPAQDSQPTCTFAGCVTPAGRACHSALVTYAGTPDLVVSVGVACVWAGPNAPRAVDAAALADVPDPVAWLAALDRRPRAEADGRYGLHGRLVTQAVRGEAVTVLEESAAGWVRVVLPGQPSSLDPRGYPGWMRRAHLVEAAHPAAPQLPVGPVADVGADADAVAVAEAVADVDVDALARARAYLGVGYLWGGTTAYGIDCSGLVLPVFGEVVPRLPRDAHDQAAVLAPVPPGQARSGDLYFFAEPGGAVDHVGIATAAGWMIDAGETRGSVAEEPLSAERAATLVSVARPSAASTDRRGSTRA